MSIANLKKVRHNAQVAKQVIDFQISAEESERTKKEKALAKAKQLADPVYIKQTKLNRIYQSKDKAKTEAGILVAENCKKLKQEIYNFLTDGVDRKASFDVLEAKINACLGLLKDFRKVVENEFINQKAQSTEYNIYEQLFNNLIDYNANFLLFAPKQCFKRNVVSAKINTLSEICQNAVKERMETFNLDEKADYVNEYLVCEVEPNEETKKVEEIFNSLNQTKEQAIDNMERATDKMGADILNFVKEEYDEIKNSRETTTKGVLDLIVATQRERKCLFDLIKDNEFVKARMSSRKMSAYDEMYNEMVNLDVKFALAAPRKVLSRLDLDFKVFTEREKDVMFERICKMGLWNIPQYVENYHHIFACQLSKINNLNVLN